MFNLPWYSWFNVLALPILWGLLYIDMAVQDRSAWMKNFIGFHILASIACIFLYWNPQLAGTLVPANYLLAVLIVPFAAWNIAQGFAELFQAIYQTAAPLFGVDEKPVRTTTASVAGDADDIDILADDLDLDGGVTCGSMDEDVAKAGKAITSLFSNRSTARDRMEGVMTLLGDDDDKASTDLWAGLIAVGIYLLIWLPPMYMSVQLLK
ncbi:MAG: hypothetical protein HKN42_14970 [Granulosicoccus sp.]|nr:hypothetical protein [Granulosicoccus sp.]